MTLHLYLDEHLAPDLSPGKTTTLTGAEAHHLLRVKRAQIGEEIFVSDGAGRRFTARIEQIAGNKKAATATLTIMADASVPQRGARLTLIQAIAKGGRDLAAIEAATEVGVSEIIAWQAERSIASWPAHKAAKAREKWDNAVRAAVKQSRRCAIPAVRGPMTSSELAAEITRRTDAGEVVIVLHEDATDPLIAAPANLTAWSAAQAVAIVVGPEGGISEKELTDVVNAGAQVRHCGPDIMRTSTAGPVALALVRALSGGWTT